MSSIIVYTDGACKGNPGRGGWGAFIKGPSQRVAELWGGSLETTNNQMELTSVIEALEWLTPVNGTPVEVWLDSQYVKDGITKWIVGWKQRGWKTATGSAVKNIDLWKRLDAATKQHTITWHWVKGHNGDPGNERADALANKGVTSSSKHQLCDWGLQPSAPMPSLPITFRGFSYRSTEELVKHVVETCIISIQPSDQPDTPDTQKLRKLLESLE